MKRFTWIPIAVAMLAATTGLAAAAPGYADWTLGSPSSGTGTFPGVVNAPDFTFSLTGDFEPGDTEIDGDDVFDNAGWEGIYGEGDNQESLRFGGNPSDDLTVTTVTINFASPVNANSMSFAVTDLEGEDAVITASLNGVPVSNPTIAGWFQGLFDSDPASSGSPHVPSGFDAANAAVVAEADSDGLLSDEIFDISGTESASGWFTIGTPIDTLTVTHRNRFGGAATMHIYMAAVDSTPPTTAVPLLGAKGLVAMLGLMIAAGAVSLRYRGKRVATGR